MLELGCASGGNLIPMAFNLPGSEFVGIDLSRHQVEDGLAMVRALDLTNIRIEHASILDVDSGWGEFDYIICHGVFSWVEPAGAGQDPRDLPRESDAGRRRVYQLQHLPWLAPA